MAGAETCGTCGQPITWQRHEGEWVPSCITTSSGGVTVHARLVDDRWVPDHVTLAGEVTAERLTTLGRTLGALVDGAVAEAMLDRSAGTWRDLTAPGFTYADLAQAPSWAEVANGGRTPEQYAGHLDKKRRSIRDHQRLEDVAAAYLSNPRTPLKQVAKDCGWSPAHASRLVAEARNAGLIPPKETP